MSCKPIDVWSLTTEQDWMGEKMSIYEAIGMSWVIFTSALASLGILYLAYVGFMTLIRKHEPRDGEVPVEVKEMFKIAR